MQEPETPPQEAAEQSEDEDDFGEMLHQLSGQEARLESFRAIANTISVKRSSFAPNAAIRYDRVLG